MTVDMSITDRRSRTFPPRFVSSEVLKQLPVRRPVDPPSPTSTLQWSIFDLDRYEVRVRGEVLGYIDVIGAVFVALTGHRYDRAVEVAQTLIFEEALCRICAHLAGSD